MVYIRHILSHAEYDEKNPRERKWLVASHRLNEPVQWRGVEWRFVGHLPRAILLRRGS
jgi:hypothetical protein